MENGVYVGEMLEVPVKVKSRPLSNIAKIIIEESGQDAYNLICDYADVNDKKTQILSTTTLFNIHKLSKREIATIINLKKINDIRRINKFFEAVNENIPRNSNFI